MKPREIIAAYRVVKHANPGKLVGVLMGDYHEFFGLDAEIVAKAIGLTLTRREGEYMVGFATHYKEQYELLLRGRGHDVLFVSF